jgi:hypothetical protein
VLAQPAADAGGHVDENAHWIPRHRPVTLRRSFVHRARDDARLGRSEPTDVF